MGERKMIARGRTAALALMVLAGCEEGAPTPWSKIAAEPQVAPQVTRGREVYEAYCTSCHGVDGAGDGPLAADLPVAPPDLRHLSAANGGQFPSDRVYEQVYGYPGRFNTSVMPEFGPLLEGPSVMVTAEDGATVRTPRALVELVAWLEHVQQD